MKDFYWLGGVCQNPFIVNLPVAGDAIMHIQFKIAKHPVDSWHCGVRILTEIWAPVLECHRVAEGRANPSGAFNAALNLVRHYFRSWPDNSPEGRLIKWLDGVWDGLHWAFDQIKEFPPGGSVLLEPLTEEPEPQEKSV